MLVSTSGAIYPLFFLPSFLSSLIALSPYCYSSPFSLRFFPTLCPPISLLPSFFPSLSFLPCSILLLFSLSLSSHTCFTFLPFLSFLSFAPLWLFIISLSLSFPFLLFGFSFFSPLPLHSFLPSIFPSSSPGQLSLSHSSPSFISLTPPVSLSSPPFLPFHLALSSFLCSSSSTLLSPY